MTIVGTTAFYLSYYDRSLPANDRTLEEYGILSPMNFPKIVVTFRLPGGGSDKLMLFQWCEQVGKRVSEIQQIENAAQSLWKCMDAKGVKTIEAFFKLSIDDFRDMLNVCQTEDAEWDDFAVLKLQNSMTEILKENGLTMGNFKKQQNSQNNILQLNHHQSQMLHQHNHQMSKEIIEIKLNRANHSMTKW